MTVQNLTSNFTYDVFIKVLNGRIWLDITDPLIRIECKVPPLPATNLTNSTVFVPKFVIATGPVAINTAPTFENEPSQEKVDLNKAQSILEIALPTATDKENDTVEISIENAPDFATLD